MLNKEEEKFIADWGKNKTQKNSLFRDIWYGLPIGILICIGVLLNYISGWYKRAAMVANSQFTPLVLMIAFILIIVFCSVFYKRHKQDMNEQRYKELSYKKSKEITHENAAGG